MSKENRDTIIGCTSLILGLAGCIAAWLALDISKIFSQASNQAAIQQVQVISIPPVAIPTLATIVGTHIVNVPADQAGYDTGISLQEGDWLEIIANNNNFRWNGINETNADGIEPDGGSERCGGECVLIGEPLGILVGVVGDVPPFRVGSFTRLQIRERGRLLLAINDNLGNCDGIGCFGDNNGMVEANVTIWRLPTTGQNALPATEAQ